jgi:hypothetical protein
MNYVVAIAALYSYSKGCAIQLMEATIATVHMQIVSASGAGVRQWSPV